MTGPDIFSADIFRLADLCIEAGCFPGLEDGHYVLRFVFVGGKACEIRRAYVNFVLPRPCRVWCMKGEKRYLLGDSHICPVDLSAGCRPPFLG